MKRLIDWLKARFFKKPRTEQGRIIRDFFGLGRDGFYYLGAIVEMTPWWK